MRDGIVQELEAKRLEMGMGNVLFAHEVLGIHYTTWYRWLRGVSRPGRSVLGRLADRFPTLSDKILIELRDRS